MRILNSTVPGFIGPCKHTYLDTNSIRIRFYGMTGFFRLVEKRWWGFKMVGEEFHGEVDIDPNTKQLIVKATK